MIFYNPWWERILRLVSFRRLCFAAFLFFNASIFTPAVFAVDPIQERPLQGVSADEARLMLITAAQSLLGTKYRYAGLDRNGLDCSGFVFLSFMEGLNYAVPRTSESMYAWAEKINTEELAPGDLVFFITSGQRISHVGIYTGDGGFIHSASRGPNTGVIYSRLDESYWRRTYKGAGRALPWDEQAFQAISVVNSGVTTQSKGGHTPM